MPQPRAANGNFVPEPVIARFLAKIVGPRLPDGTLDPRQCWTWVGARKRRRSGTVGKLWYAGRTISAARIALAISTGELKGPEVQACHTRDCPTGTECVNWNHLRWGSVDENREDHVATHGKWGMNRKYGRAENADRSESSTTEDQRGAGWAAGGADGAAAAADASPADTVAGDGTDARAEPAAAAARGPSHAPGAAYAGAVDDDIVPF